MANQKPNILFVDDEEVFLRSLTRSVKRHEPGFECHVAHNEKAAIEAAKRIQPEVIVLDLCITPSVGTESGVLLMPRLFEVVDCVRILVLTGSIDLEWGIRAINAGAASFLSKPVDTDHY